MSSASAYNRIAGELRELEKSLRVWLERPHRWPFSKEQEQTLKSHGDDLTRQASALLAERPSLVIMLMGGTGVGKSSLLNALAKGTIAEAAFTRPTTREPIVYLHRVFDMTRLDGALRECKLVHHEQPGLEHKVIVDTPDLDSNETIHRERLERVLPLADVVLYVGSQEKYHDQAGWELFLKQRERRAFAFVLNKWDRCIATSATGVRPDQDLLRDLRGAGFTDPLLFRTCAQAWISANGKPPRDLPPDEQVPALTRWLEQGLTQREMEAIRTQGIVQLLDQLHKILTDVQPPDVQAAAQQTAGAWQRTLKEEVRIQADVLVCSVALHQKSVERRFSTAIAHPFRGIMGLYARLLDFARHGILVSKLPQLSGGSIAGAEPAMGELGGFARSCAHDAHGRTLAARNIALADRLVANADDAGLPTTNLGQDIQANLQSLNEPAYAGQLGGALHAAEQSLAGEKSWRRRFTKLWTWAGDVLPWGIMVTVLGWQMYAKFFGTAFISVTDLILLPPRAALLTMTLLYVIYRWTVPVTWSKLAPVCNQHLRDNLHLSFQTALQALPEQQAKLLAEERQRIGELLTQSNGIRKEIQQHEQSAQVAVLYAQ